EACAAFADIGAACWHRACAARKSAGGASSWQRAKGSVVITNPALTDESGQSLTAPVVQFLRSEFGGGASTGTWPTNPPDPAHFDASATPSGTPRTKLANILADVETRNLGPMCFGIVNLDRPRVDPPVVYDFAGWGLHTQTAVGSCAKIWCMY